MKKILIYGLAAGLVCAIGGTVLADDFSGYPGDLQIYTGITTLRVRDSGQLTFGDSDDVSFAYDTTNDEVDITGAVNVSGGVTFSGAVTLGDGTGAVTFNSGTYGTSNSDDDITNVGDIAVDSISADGSALSIDSNWDAAGVTCSDLGTVTTVDLNGGSIDGATIGAASAGAITGSTITGTTITDSTVSLSGGTFSGIADLGTVTTADINAGTVDATIGGTTPAAGAFTTIAASSTVDINGSIDADVTGATIDSTGAVAIQSTTAGGANVGTLIKSTFQAGETYTGGSTGGLIIKAYDADNTVVHEGGEHTGLYVNLKQSSAMTAAGESSLATFHNYPGDVNPDFGLRVFGNVNDSSLQFAAGTPGLYVIDMDLATPATGDIRVSGAQVITSGTWTANSEVYAGVDAGLPVGSMAIGAGKVYIKLTNNGNEGDWEYIDTSDD